MTKLESILQTIQDSPEQIEFNDIMDVVNDHYRYSPSMFSNGADGDNIINQAGENEGSCKVFSFAKIHHLSELQTLHCFGKYYREDVIQHPDNDDHKNIRTFIKYGWKNINFEGSPLSEMTTG